MREKLNICCPRVFYNLKRLINNHWDGNSLTRRHHPSVLLTMFAVARVYNKVPC
jgi:hypothetical protein